MPERAEAGVRLQGGRSTVVERVGGSVHRPAQPWTPAVHGVLRHLEAVGFVGAPQVLGYDDTGREVLTYLDGDTVGEQLPWPAWVFSDAALEQVGAWLRRLHDATATYVPPADATWFAGQTWRPGHVIGHHDAAPFNAVWHNAALIGFVDWDTAGPSSRELDLAYATMVWTPLYPPAFAAQCGFTAFDDRSRRLHLMLDAYGYDQDRTEFPTLIAGRARLNADVIRRRAASGDPTYAAMLPLADNMEQAAIGVDNLPPEFWAA
jgi:hypothetical protein